MVAGRPAHWIPWIKYTNTAPQHPDDLGVFSRPLARWKEFRRWQCDNRRSIYGTANESLAAFREDKKRYFESTGLGSITAGPERCSFWDCIEYYISTHCHYLSCSYDSRTSCKSPRVILFNYSLKHITVAEHKYRSCVFWHMEKGSISRNSDRQ